MNLANKILGMDDRKSKSIPIKEWEGTFTIKELNVKMREEFEIASQLGDMKNITKMKPLLVIGCVYSDDGEKVFNKSHATKLSEKSGDVIDRICRIILELSDITAEVEEEAEKNS